MRLIHILGDPPLQGCSGWEHGETYMGTGTLMVVGVAVVGKSRETCT